MRRIAIRALLHDRSKLAAALAGVAFATALLLVQLGIYRGFLASASSLVERLGGDVWVMARGTEVLDNGEALSESSRRVAVSHPCVARARGVVLAFGFLRKASGGRDNVQVVGIEQDNPQVVPWSLARGLPNDLFLPDRISLDVLDLAKLHVRGEPMGQSVQISGRTVRVAALTRGVRSFTLLPYVFTSLTTARALAGMRDGQATYWLLDLRDPSCVPDVIATVERHRDLQAIARDRFARQTEDYWVNGSGAGTAIQFMALLGLVVGVVIVGQILFSITKEHARELGTLKALGARGRELVGFVLWQAAFLATVGLILGGLFALGIRHGLAQIGLAVILSPRVLGLGVLAVFLMCAIASASSVRRVLALDAAEVFK